MTLHLDTLPPTPCPACSAQGWFYPGTWLTRPCTRCHGNGYLDRHGQPVEAQPVDVEFSEN